MLLCKEFIVAENSPPHNHAAHNNISWHCLGVLAGVSVLWNSPSLCVLSGVSVLWHSPSLGVLAGVSVLWNSPSLGVLAGVSVLWHSPSLGCVSVLLHSSSLGVLVSVLWHSPSLGVLAGVSVLWHSPSLGVLAGDNVFWHSPSLGVLAADNILQQWWARYITSQGRGVTILKGKLKWRSIADPVWGNEIHTADFTPAEVLFIENRRLKVAKTGPWTLPFCTQQSASVTSWTGQACVEQSVKDVTRQPISALYW